MLCQLCLYYDMIFEIILDLILWLIMYPYESDAFCSPGRILETWWIMLWSMLWSMLWFPFPFLFRASSRRFCKVARSARSWAMAAVSEVSIRRSNSFRIASFRSSKGARLDCFHSFKQAPNSTMRLMSPLSNHLKVYTSSDTSDTVYSTKQVMMSNSVRHVTFS